MAFGASPPELRDHCIGDGGQVISSALMCWDGYEKRRGTESAREFETPTAAVRKLTIGQ